MMPRPMTRVHGGPADRDVAELERIYTLDKPVPEFRERVHSLVIAIVACAAIMIVSALFIMEAAK